MLIEHSTPAASIAGSGMGLDACRPRGCARSRPGTRRRRCPRAASSSSSAGIVDGADAVPEPVGAERVERAADRRDAFGLAGVRYRTEPAVLRDAERGRERLGREPGLAAAEPDGDDAAVAVLDRVARGLDRGLEREAARDVGRQPDLDAVVSVASTAPSQKPVNTSSHDAPPLIRSAGVKMPSM